jgi:DNA-binding HxlR family transcriptional regulator
MILFHLASDRRRFSELKRLIEGISDRMLSHELKDLEASGIVTRKQFPVIPPKTEYALSALGQSLEPILVQMADWGMKYAASPNARKAKR